jgi:hypothetical protein
MVAKPDKTFTISDSSVSYSGKWLIYGDDVIFTPELFEGVPVGEAMSMLQQHSSKFPQRLKDFVDGLEMPNVLKLSDDGTQMLTDGKRDKHKSIPLSFTKSE